METEIVDMEPKRSGGAVVAADTSPQGLLRFAMTNGASMEQVERFMALWREEQQQQARNACTESLVLFKAEPMEIFKRKAVGYWTKPRDGSDAEFVGYKHAELSDVTAAVVPAMSKHGLAHRWDVKQEGGQVVVTCIVTHKMGHTERVTMSAPPDASGKKNTIQAIASTVSYLQRYTLLAITGMATTGDDNDGQGDKGDDNGSAASYADEQPQGPALYPAADFTKNKAQWRQVVQSGRKTAQQMIDTIQQRGPLTNEQQAEIRSFENFAKGTK